MKETGFLALILDKRRPNFGQKANKIVFSPQKWSNSPQRAKIGPGLFYFGSRLLSHRAENTSKSLPFRQKIYPYQNQTNSKTFDHKIIIFCPKNLKNTSSKNGFISKLELSNKSYEHFKLCTGGFFEVFEKTVHRQV